MSSGYGRKERIKIVWEDAHKSNKFNLKKGAVVFEGTGKYCGEQTIRWLYQKEFLNPIDVLKLSLRLDIKLFGRLWKMWEAEKARAPAETFGMIEEKPGF